MARRSIRKRRHNGFASKEEFERAMEFFGRIDITGRRAGMSEAVRMMVHYTKKDFDRAFGWEVPDVVSFDELWRETYSAGPDIKPSGFVTVVRVDRDAGTFTSE